MDRVENSLIRWVPGLLPGVADDRHQDRERLAIDEVDQRERKEERKDPSAHLTMDGREPGQCFPGGSAHPCARHAWSNSCSRASRRSIVL
jgi:hypothetical protein